MPSDGFSPVAEYALRLGDDALVSAQRLAEWCSRAPELEEDIALANIALDQLGAARLLLTYAGSAAGRSEDDLAYLRDPHEFRNCLLAELPNAGPAATHGAPADFGVTMGRLLLLGAYQLHTFSALQGSPDETLSAIAAKARLQWQYHVDHAAQWTVRLGDGTGESRRRMQAAIDDLWPYTHELFEDDELSRELAAAGVVPPPSRLRPQWTELVGDVLARATLPITDGDWAPSGGRAGRHTEHLSYLLAELQVVHRAHPGAAW